jgi:serine/threonine protein kinase
MLKENLEIKDYTLKKFLGRGGFGEVWLAEKKIEIADRKVPFALKFLSGDKQRLSDISSVRREINTWIEASGNKNVVSVLEYADGGSLRHWLRANGGKSPYLKKTVEIMSGILDGLSHLHAQKIIHRDLKPENILLKGDVPCIADFGVSRMIETVSQTSSNFGTNSAGSPLYMSPESFERTKPSPQIDIWSAGVILFEMLSGKTPYIGDTIPALIFEIVTKEPRSLPPDVPAEIQKVVNKALAKNAVERFQTAREMRDALMKALYFQGDLDETVNEEFIPTLKHDENFALTEPLPKEQAKTVGKKKTGVWIGLGAGAVLAASAGIIGVTQYSNQNNSNPADNSNSALIIVSEKPAISNVENANAANTNAAEIRQTNENPLQTAETQPKKDQTPRPTQAKSASTKPAAKPKPTAKKKVTLDDLIN